ncbi:hypothetical protein BKN49_05735 [Pseudomonas aeruginosa]|jgi:hypothetical protein|nr:hypothetical protein BKN49_05735 [Pseudomonas aeruginosa]
MAEKAFNQWLYEDGRDEALQDVYFEDRIGPGSEYLEWAESVYKAMQQPPSANEPRSRIWPFTK